MSRYLTRAGFYSQAQAWVDKGLMYWQKPNVRWEYISVVMEILRKMEPATSIEMGSYGIKCIKDSVTVDKKRLGNAYPQMILNGNSTPYPFETGQFDVFIALQVFEHVKNKVGAFQEAKRIAKNVILSLPYNIPFIPEDPLNCHTEIGDREIAGWFGEPTRKVVIGNRIVCLWKNHATDIKN